MPRPKKDGTPPAAPMSNEERLAKIDSQIEYCESRLESLNDKRQKLVDRIEGRSLLSAGGRRRSPETEALASALGTKSPEEIIEMARRAQREAAFLARAAKAAKSAFAPELTAAE